MDLNPLNQIDPLVIVAVIAIYWATFVVVRRVFFVPYVRVLEARAGRLDAAEVAADEAAKVRAEADALTDQVLCDARERAENVVRRASEDGEARRRQAMQSAGEQIGRMLEEGRDRIAKEREGELALLHDEAIECVGLACEKLVGETDDATVRAAVEKLLARRMH